ncbi:unnamed protein product, partial [marine sediment metagenome]
HRLIEHQAQLPLPELRVTGKPAIQVTGKPTLRIAPVTTPVALRHKLPVSIATNGSKMPAFRIQPKGVSYD